MISLRAQEGPQSSSSADGSTQQEDTAPKKKDKKKGKGAGDATYCTTRPCQSYFYSDAMKAPQPILSKFLDYGAPDAICLTTNSPHISYQLHACRIHPWQGDCHVEGVSGASCRRPVCRPGCTHRKALPWRWRCGQRRGSGSTGGRLPASGCCAGTALPQETLTLEALPALYSGIQAALQWINTIKTFSSPGIEVTV